MYTRNFGVESDGELFKMQQEAFSKLDEHNNAGSPPVHNSPTVGAAAPAFSPAAESPALEAIDDLAPSGKHELSDGAGSNPVKRGLLNFDFKNILKSINFDDILLVLIIILLLMDDGSGDDNNDELLLVLAILFVIGFN